MTSSIFLQGKCLKSRTLSRLIILPSLRLPNQATLIRQSVSDSVPRIQALVTEEWKHFRASREEAIDKRRDGG